MKIGILTFHSAINYGAVLQAYGLQESLKSMGHEVYIIDYRPNCLEQSYKLFFVKNVTGCGIIKGIHLFVRELLAIPIRYKRKCAFKKFREENLSLLKLNIYIKESDIDLFILGSDQIWNFNITKGDSVFIGDAPIFKGKNLISYGASVGSINYLEEKEIAILNKHLINFDNISVRESSLKKIISEKMNIQVSKVLDPVLLAGKDVFMRICRKNNYDRSYLLLFTLWGHPQANKIAHKIASLKGLDVIEIMSNNEIIRFSNVKQKLSPSEFLGYILNANYIVTTSYHGTALSILFNKQFTFYCDNEILSERMYDLLSDLNLTDRICYPSKSIDITEVNYEEVLLKLNGLRKSSYDYLSKSIIKCL